MIERDKKTYVKFVKKARMWCKTTTWFDEKGNKKYKQEWFEQKPEV